jgi:hypothetical protein
MEDVMFSKIALLLTVTAAAGATVVLASNDAYARGGKEHFVQDYKFNKPMHGYSGRAGNYYCDYVRIPDRKCAVVGGAERCKVVGWTLRQTCY